MSRVGAQGEGHMAVLATTTGAGGIHEPFELPPMNWVYKLMAAYASIGSASTTSAVALRTNATPGLTAPASIVELMSVPDLVTPVLVFDTVFEGITFESGVMLLAGHMALTGFTAAARTVRMDMYGEFVRVSDLEFAKLVRQVSGNT